MITIAEVEELQEQIEHCKTKKAELEGEKKAIMKQLQEEWEFTTVKQTKKEIVKEENKILELQEDIDKDLKELEEQYGF